MMKNFVGIDLGTTNSAICSYDGSETRIWKSPEQNDVTPSAIFVGRRGQKYIGQRAYDSAPHSPGNVAILFKRLMGTSTPIKLPAVDLTMTPEECSAEILKFLYGYLPEEIRDNPETGTVITVPAAFNQMQKDATMQAASLAGIGKVALMQEPVAAVMSVMRTRNTDGMFLIYDLGGGTLDIAIAESIDGHVNLLANGGISMCGGRDFDRIIVDNVVRQWLFENFNLPDDVWINSDYKTLKGITTWAAEKTKIELSSREDALISLSETESRTRDLDGTEIYLDIEIVRETIDNLIEERIMESIDAAREILTKNGLTNNDLERIVFVGGPTNYKPLRDKVSFELGIPGSTDVNPMTSVAEGASLFAESIDWSSQNRSRKDTRGSISSGGDLDLSFNYISRTPSTRGKIAVRVGGQVEPGSEFQVDSVDTGWTSGRLPLENGSVVDVTLAKTGENIFKIFVFNPSGGPINQENDKIIITRTAATVDAIPASYSICIEAKDKVGGHSIPVYLVRAGDLLPKKGKEIFKAVTSLKAGDSDSLIFNLWEGEIEDPVSDNRPIGTLKISGSDFDDGVIPARAELICEYEVLDSGNIILEISIPSIGGMFDSRGKNFYSRVEGESDFLLESTRQRVIEDGESILARLDEIAEKVDDPKIEKARQKLEPALSLDIEESDSEKTKRADEQVFEARKIMSQVRQEHLKEIRQIELDGVTDFFDEIVREHARPSESTAFDRLTKTAQTAIDKNNRDFEYRVDELKGKNFEILWRQDWFVINHFKRMLQNPGQFTDQQRFADLSALGMQYIQSDDIDELRGVVGVLFSIRRGGGMEEDMLEAANIIRG